MFATRKAAIFITALATIVSLAGAGFIVAQALGGAQQSQAGTTPTSLDPFINKLAQNLHLDAKTVHDALVQTELQILDDTSHSGAIPPAAVEQLRPRISGGEVLFLGPAGLYPIAPADRGPMASIPGFVQLVPAFLNLDPTVFGQELSTGKTLTQVAEAHGKTQAQLIDFLVARVSDEFAQALKAGAITQQQAEQMKQGLTTGIAQLVTTPLAGSPMARQEQGGPLGVFDLIPGSLVSMQPPSRPS